MMRGLGWVELWVGRGGRVYSCYDCAADLKLQLCTIISNIMLIKGMYAQAISEPPPTSELLAGETGVDSVYCFVDVV